MNEQKHIIETFTEMASRYDKLMNSELNRFWGINYFEFVSDVLGEIEINETSVVLDIATGTAFIPRYLIKQEIPPGTITGLDLTFEMLINGKEQIENHDVENKIHLVCATAHEMPFRQNAFDIAICCLATHHMNVEKLLSQIHASLKHGGKFHIGDVGGSEKWKIGFIRVVIKTFAFVYFLFKENLSRAKAESKAVANVMSSGEWHQCILEKGFENVKIREIRSDRFWIPNPVIIEATKKLEER